jgi:spore germination protein KB
MIAIIGVILLLFKDMDVKELTPLLEKGIYPSILTGLSPVSQTVEIIGMAMIMPFLNDRNKMIKVYILTPLLLGFFLFIMTTSVIALLGDNLAKSMTYPFFSIVRLVHVGDFLERIEALHVTIWILGMFIRIVFYYYLIVLGLAQVFSLKDLKPLILPTGTIIVSLSFVLGASIVEYREFTSFEIYTWYTLFFILLIPSLLLLTAILRKKGERSR